MPVRKIMTLSLRLTTMRLDLGLVLFLCCLAVWSLPNDPAIRDDKLRYSPWHRPFPRFRFCTEAEYNKTTDKACNREVFTIVVDGLCIGRSWVWLNYTDADKACKRLGGDLVKHAGSKRVEAIKKVIFNTAEFYWIGANKYFQSDLRHRDNTKAKAYQWKDDEPKDINRRRCIKLWAFAWSTSLCGDKHLFLCQKKLTAAGKTFKEGLLRGSQAGINDPWNSTVIVGYNFRIICHTPEYMEKRYPQIHLKGGAYTNGKWITNSSSTDRSIISITYGMLYLNENRECVGRRVLNATFRASKRLTGITIHCCFGKSLDRKNCDKMGPYSMIYRAVTPHANVIPKSLVAHVGDDYSCLCTNMMGENKKSAISVKSTKCGEKIFENTLPGDELSTEGNGVDDCFDVESGWRREEDEAYHGNAKFMKVSAKVTADQIGTLCYCYSYDAGTRYKEEGEGANPWTTRDKYLSTELGPLVVTFTPEAPELVVKWPTDTEGIIHGNRFLKATCASYVGTGGVLEWMLLPLTYEKTTYTLHYKTKVQETPRGVIVENSPKVLTCEEPTPLEDMNAHTCLGLSTDARSWANASETSRALGYNLVSIELPSRNALIRDYLVHATGQSNVTLYWIGLNPPSNDSAPRWSSKPESEVKFKNFATDVNLADLPSDTCVAFEKETGAWQTQPCSEELPYIFQIPEGNIKDEEDIDKLKGYRITSVFSIFVNKTLERAKLVCHVKNDKYGIKFHEQRDTTFELFRYTYDTQTLTTTRLTLDGWRFLKMNCSAPVGDNGTMTVAAFHKKGIKFLYFINLDEEVIEEKPLEEIKIKEIEVTEDYYAGPVLIVIIEVKVTAEMVNVDFVCEPFNISSFPDYNKTASLGRFRIEESERLIFSPGGGLLNFLLPAVLLASILAVLSSTMTPSAGTVTAAGGETKVSAGEGEGDGEPIQLQAE